MVDIDIRFQVDRDKCTSCKSCVKDCVAEIIHMDGAIPAVTQERMTECLYCQHCLAVCPTGAISILGKSPKGSLSLVPRQFDVAQLDLLVRGRRSVRQFKQEPVDSHTLKMILDSMAYAPTGVNNCSRRVTVITNRKTLETFRQECAEALVTAANEKRIPEQLMWLEDLARNWLDSGKDDIFRNAPHLITVSAPKDAPCPTQDALISLSYFELLAQARGIGTVWAGILYWILAVAAPEMRTRLGIPENHTFGYAMLFGLPAVVYPRTVQREMEDLVLLDHLR